MPTSKSHFRQVVGFQSKSRPDILKAIEGEEIRPNEVRSDGHHLEWNTTPTELQRLVEEFAKQNWKYSTDVYVPSASGDHLSLRKSNSQGLRFHRFVGWEVTFYLNRATLRRLAARLANAPWEKKRVDTEYGSDRRVAKVRVDDDIVILIWTPETDQDGNRQVSPMEWRAWWNIQSRQFAKEMEETRRRSLPIRPFDPSPRFRAMV